MNGPTHMAFGAAAAAVLIGPVAAVTGVGETPAIMMPLAVYLGAVAGLLPDIDEPNAMFCRGSWLPKPLRRTLGPLVWVAMLPFKLVGILIKGLLGHRGGTHSLAMSFIVTLLFAIPVTLLFGRAGDWAILVLWAGYMSHLAADMLNPSGVPFVWPLMSKHKTFHLIPSPLRISTQTPPAVREMGLRYLMWGVAWILLLAFGVPAAIHQLQQLGF
jgi:inner membrane protein